MIWQKSGLKGNEKLPVDLKDIQKGIYFIEINDTGKKVYSEKTFCTIINLLPSKFLAKRGKKFSFGIWKNKLDPTMEQKNIICSIT